MAVLGHGNGFSFEALPFCSYANRDGVHVMLAGEVAEWPGISAVAAAHDGACLCVLPVVAAVRLQRRKQPLYMCETAWRSPVQWLQSHYTKGLPSDAAM